MDPLGQEEQVLEGVSGGRYADTDLESKGRRSRVTRRLALLLKGHEQTYVRLYIDFPRSDADEIGWSRFQRILRASGYTRRVGKHSVQRLDPEIAAAIDRKWPRVR